MTLELFCLSAIPDASLTDRASTNTITGIA